MARFMLMFLALWALAFVTLYHHNNWTVSGWKAVGKSLWWGAVSAAVVVVLFALIFTFF